MHIAYGLAADGVVLKNGMPRNPFHAPLLLDMREGRLPGAYAALDASLATTALRRVHSRSSEGARLVVATLAWTNAERADRSRRDARFVRESECRRRR